jgi:anti-sigma B factor antagonist
VSPRGETDPPLPPGLDLDHRVVDGTFVIAAIGDVDSDTAPALSAAINACVDQADDGPCILDLSRVTFLDSAGLTALLHATLHSEAQRQPLPIVVDANRPVIRPIEVTGLDDTLTLYHTVDEALNATKSSAVNADGSPYPA